MTKTSPYMLPTVVHGTAWPDFACCDCKFERDREDASGWLGRAPAITSAQMTCLHDELGLAPEDHARGNLRNVCS